MRLALGEEADCIADITIACDLDIANVIVHINALPEEAKKLLLFWIGNCLSYYMLNFVQIILLCHHRSSSSCIVTQLWLPRERSH